MFVYWSSSEALFLVVLAPHDCYHPLCLPKSPCPLGDIKLEVVPDPPTSYPREIGHPTAQEPAA